MPKALAPSPSSSEELFLSCLGKIETIVRCICRRHRMSAEESEEFASEVKVRLIDKDYHILSSWEGRAGASFETYLTTVIVRMRLDFVRQLTGKYLRSEAAARLGPYAVELEKSMVLGERTFHEAFEHLRPAFPEVSEEQAEAIAKSLPVREKRRFVSEESLATRPAPNAGADTLFLERERAGRRKRLLAVLGEARGRLPEEDRLIVRLLLDDEWKIVRIAGHLKRDPKPLYKHIQRIWNRLREDLERNGFRRQDFAEAFEQDADDDPDPEAGGNR